MNLSLKKLTKKEDNMDIKNVANLLKNKELKRGLSFKAIPLQNQFVRAGLDFSKQLERQYEFNFIVKTFNSLMRKKYNNIVNSNNNSNYDKKNSYKNNSNIDSDKLILPMIKDSNLKKQNVDSDINTNKSDNFINFNNEMLHFNVNGINNKSASPENIKITNYNNINSTYSNNINKDRGSSGLVMNELSKLSTQSTKVKTKNKTRNIEQSKTNNPNPINIFNNSNSSMTQSVFNHLTKNNNSNYSKKIIKEINSSESERSKQKIKSIFRNISNVSIFEAYKKRYLSSIEEYKLKNKQAEKNFKEQLEKIKKEKIPKSKNEEYFKEYKINFSLGDVVKKLKNEFNFFQMDSPPKKKIKSVKIINKNKRKNTCFQDNNKKVYKSYFHEAIKPSQKTIQNMMRKEKNLEMYEESLLEQLK